jgi:predicted lysophospholipase L1 biosynthesis ABC-type transport system permease subunit
LSSPKTLILALCLASAACALAMRGVTRCGDGDRKPDAAVWKTMGKWWFNGI